MTTHYKAGQISESQRTLILQHSDPRVFTRNYESTYITADTQAAYRGLEPQTAIMRAASGMSRTIDTRRPRDLSPEQIAQLDRHPELKLLRRQRHRLEAEISDIYGGRRRAKGLPISDEYQRVLKEYRNRRKRLRDSQLKEVKRKYEKEQPIIDIERQLSGKGVKKEIGETLKAYAFKKRFVAVESLFTFAITSSEDECTRRAEAIAALAALACRHEGRCAKETARSVKYTVIKVEPEELTSSVDAPAVSPKNVSDPRMCKPTQCIFCLGQQELSTERRVKSFHSSGDLKKHFYRKHLRYLPKLGSLVCPHPFCDEVLEHIMHLQSHAELIHGTRT